MGSNFSVFLSFLFYHTMSSSDNKRNEKSRRREDDKHPRREKKDRREGRKRSPSHRRPSPSPSPRHDEGMESRLSKLFLGTKEELVTRIDEGVKPVVGQIDGVASQLNQRMEHIETKVDVVQSELTSEIQRVERESKDNFESLAQRLKVLEVSNQDLRDRLQVAESAEPVKKPRAGWDRAPDPTIIKANTKSCVSRDAIRGVITDILDKAGLKPDVCVVKGEAIATYFVIVFKGTPTIAACNVDRVLESLRSEDDDGRVVWDKLFVSDPNKSQVSVSLGRDKSGKQKATEVLSK